MTDSQSSRPWFVEGPPIDRIEIERQYAEAYKRMLTLRMDAKHAGSRDVELLTEAETRIGQLLYALTRFREIEATNRRAVLPLDSSYTDVMGEYAGAPELEFYAEAFYYFAARLIDVLNRTARFSTFDAAAIRRVRNHLIEHADGARGVMSRNYTYDRPEGFILKMFGQGSPGRKSPESGQRDTFDDGLYPNAAALVHGLLRTTEAQAPVRSDVRDVARAMDEISAGESGQRCPNDC